MWVERNRKLAPNGKQYGLAPLHKAIALTKIMVGRSKGYFDIWEADHTQDEDCGFNQTLGKVRDYPRKPTLKHLPPTKTTATRRDQSAPILVACSSHRSKPSV